jgi:hypothetical protein
MTTPATAIGEVTPPMTCAKVLVRLSGRATAGRRKRDDNDDNRQRKIYVIGGTS